MTLRDVVVTVDSRISSAGQGFWIQDAGGGMYSGMRVYIEDTTDVGIVEGAVIDVTGTVAEYFDLTQIQPTSVADVVVSDAIVTPTVDVVDPETTTDWEPGRVSSFSSMRSSSERTLATASMRSRSVMT